MGVAATVAVEQIDDRQVGAVLPLWADHDAFDILVHGGAMDQDGICLAGEGVAGHQEEEWEEELHRMNI